MAESWKDKTVSLGNVKKEEFDTELSHVTVSENSISVEFKDVEDWKRLKREVGEDAILKKVDWGEVESLDKKVEHLYYPHIDVETEEGEKRLYFHEDEMETLQSCFNAIKRYWNLYRESGPRSRNSYSYEEGDTREEGEESGEEREEVEVEDPDAEEDEGPDEEEVEELVEDLMDG